MRFMVLVKATAESEKGMSGDEKTLGMLNAMGKYNEELVKAGVMLEGEGLHPSSKGVRVRFGGAGKPARVIDGPFAETKELVAGYWLWEVKSRDEAVEWLKRAPFAEGDVVEVRQVFDAADFEAAGIPADSEPMVREAGLRGQLKKP